jgi:pimeloyl-ACP methyl ester carboxylesterase
MPYLLVNDINMYYEMHGQGHPLVLVAGFSSHRYYWQPFLPELSKHFQVIILENRGAGESDAPPGPYSIEMLAQDTASLLEALKIENAYILGQSMGGSIVQQICLDFPHLVKKAIISCTAAKFSKAFLLNIDLQLALDDGGADKRLMLKSRLPWICSSKFLSKEENIEGFLELILADPYPQSRQGCLGQLAALYSFNSIDRLHEIQKPLLVLAGDEDLITPLPYAQTLAEKIPNAKLFVFKGEGHAAIRENVQETLELMFSFFK